MGWTQSEKNCMNYLISITLKIMETQINWFLNIFIIATLFDLFSCRILIFIVAIYSLYCSRDFTLNLFHIIQIYFRVTVNLTIHYISPGILCSLLLLVLWFLLSTFHWIIFYDSLTIWLYVLKPLFSCTERFMKSTGLSVIHNE